MCGFLAFFSSALSQESFPELREHATRLRHRGNTDHGAWADEHAALFHHRLAFRDIKQGQQPMLSGEAVIVFNGELYGFEKLRSELKHDFKSRSDTEVLLAGLKERGGNLLRDLDGEYAFVFWDKKKLLAGRDAFGVKPIFFHAENLPASLFRQFKKRYEFKVAGSLSFASEIKALPGKREWCPDGSKRQFLGLYEEMGTAFKDVFLLPPGSVFSAELKNGEWHCSIERVIERRRRAGHKDFYEAAEELKSILSETLALKLDSEVPLGVYLSGGIDSRIAAFELGRRQEKIDSFTVGFEGADYDESDEVKKFIKAYPGMRSHILKTNNEALNYSYEHAIYASEMIQPYTNGCAKWWLSRFARRHVQGVLTGDGADEMFCGYPSYRYLAWWQFYQKNPSTARGQLYRKRVQGNDEKYWERGLSSQADGRDLIESQAILGWFHPLFAQIKAMAVIWHGSEREAIKYLQSVRDSIFSYVADDVESGATPLQTWQNYFLHTHFPTHILNWVGDRMEMANTLEGRPLYLSRKILSLVQELPDHALVRGLKDKAVLRRAYAQDLGDFSRTPKKQFNAPFLQPTKISGGSFLPVDSLTRAVGKNPLAESYAQMFRQNARVSEMLEKNFIKDQVPVRDLSYEEGFLDTHSSDL